MSTFVTKYAREKGLKKVDAKSNLVVQLRPKDIRQSKVKDPGNCAFARCVRETVPGVKAAYFFRSTAWLEHADKIVRYQLPKSVQSEIVAFDRARAMEPGVYQLSKPVKSFRMSNVKKRNAHRKGRHQPKGTRIKRKLIHRTTNVRGLTKP